METDSLLKNMDGISSFSRRRRKRDAPPVLRGGSHINNARNCRSAYRNHNDARNINHNVGVRVVVSAVSTLD
jgi:formylglycine-generating enzyme required for sulfatase activity